MRRKSLPCGVYKSPVSGTKDSIMDDFLDTQRAQPMRSR